MNQDRDPLTRPQRRSDYNKKKKMDRILTILIVIVSVLIIANFISLLTKDNEQPVEVVNEDKNKDAEKNSELNDDIDTENNESNSESSSEDSSEEQLDNEEGQIVVKPSNDPIVSEVIENPQWDVTPTQQTGEHISAYEEGHIDYIEKLQTLRNAVKLDENNIIYWSVKHNGSPSQSVGVVSTYDKSEMYRIYIEWIDGKGWKPVNVERLRQLEGAY